MIDIAKNVNKGLNKIELDSTIVQSDACYKHLDNSWTFEAMKNCLSYDMEVEPIYLAGDFGLDIRGELCEIDNDSYRISEMPIITGAPRTVDIERLDLSGYSQFSGKLTLEKTFTLTDTHRHVILKGRGINSIRLAVNGKEVKTVMNPPYSVDITEQLHPGENTVTLTLLNNLRNMMGPHHLTVGECFFVCPSSFYMESNIFNPLPGADGSCHGTLPQWRDDYCFVHFGLECGE